MFELPVSIIGGYLGSGKTTWINQRLKENRAVRYAVIVNDFGELNIDAQLIDSVDQLTITLENGCVCCSLAGGVDQAVQAITNIADAIDWVLLEASGVADPTRVKAQVQSWPGFTLHDTLTLIDATRIQKLTKDKYVGKHIQKQLMEADEILLTKTDLISGADRSKLDDWLCQQRGRPSIVATLTKTQLPEFSTERIDSATFRDRQSLESWLDALDDTTSRVKGLVKFNDSPDPSKDQWFVIQWVDRKWTITEHQGPEPSKPGIVRIMAAPNSQSVPDSRL
ncbi:MAG: G3E family GTPase [Candidatus Azotimanducaceae bacterium]